MKTQEQLEEALGKTKALESQVGELSGKLDEASAKVKKLEEEKQSFLAGGGGSGFVTAGNRMGSDEARALKYFQCSHPKQLLDVNVAHPKFKRVPDECKALVLNFKRAVDVSRAISQMYHDAPKDKIDKTDEKRDKIAQVKGILDHRYAKDQLAPYLKAFGTGSAGEGAEWVPTLIATTYLEEYELERVLEGRFQQRTLPSKNWDMPFKKNVGKARIATEGQTGFAAGTFGTDAINFQAVKLEEYYEIPMELDEDSAPDFVSAARDEVVMAQERASESAIINGDDDGTHIDSDTQAGGAELAEKAWKGLRALALANSANGVVVDIGNVAIANAGLTSMRGAGGKFFSNTRDALIIAGPAVYNQLTDMDEVKTVEKFGPMATILNGALASWKGMPIINSEHFREDLSDAGVYDGVTTDRAGVIMVNLRRFFFGTRRPIRVRLVEDLPPNDRWLMASYRRVDFKGVDQSATEKSVVYGINIAI